MNERTDKLLGELYRETVSAEPPRELDATILAAAADAARMATSKKTPRPGQTRWAGWRLAAGGLVCGALAMVLIAPSLRHEIDQREQVASLPAAAPVAPLAPRQDAKASTADGAAPVPLAIQKRNSTGPLANAPLPGRHENTTAPEAAAKVRNIPPAAPAVASSPPVTLDSVTTERARGKLADTIGQAAQRSEVGVSIPSPPATPATPATPTTPAPALAKAEVSTLPPPAPAVTPPAAPAPAPMHAPDMSMAPPVPTAAPAPAKPQVPRRLAAQEKSSTDLPRGADPLLVALLDDLANPTMSRDEENSAFARCALPLGEMLAANRNAEANALVRGCASQYPHALLGQKYLEQANKK